MKVRAFFIASFVAIFIPAMFGATKLEPQTSAEQFLPESHPFQRFITASNNFLASNQDETVSMQIAYGFNVDEPMNLDGVNRLFNPVRSLGAATWSLHMPDMTRHVLLTHCCCVPYHSGQQGQGRLPRRVRAHY